MEVLQRCVVLLRGPRKLIVEELPDPPVILVHNWANLHVASNIFLLYCSIALLTAALHLVLDE